MKKKLIVQKFGGSSLSSIKKIKRAAQKIKKEIISGNNVVVVVSALGKTTDYLQSLINKTDVNADLKEIDTILSSGEQVSSALMALFLNKIGINARSFLGWQIPILTNKFYGKAKILDINVNFLKQIIKNGVTPIIAGFQGISEELRITTIGRGGSDTTAVAIASKLHADRCEIFTDVDGVFTTDPRVVPSARKMNTVSFEELLEVFWKTHDPTTLNRQGADTGTQYRSGIYYHSDEQKKRALELKKKLEAAKINHASPIIFPIRFFEFLERAEHAHLPLLWLSCVWKIFFYFQ